MCTKHRWIICKRLTFKGNYLFLLRMIIHWPAFLYWVTQLPSPQSLKTSTRTTSSNCISSPTSITSDQRVNSLLRGRETSHPDAHFLSIFAVLFHLRCQKTDETSVSSCRWMEVIRSATIPSNRARALNSKESHPHWFSHTQFQHAVSLGGICPSCISGLFSFLHISGTFILVSMHIWCFLML